MTDRLVNNPNAYRIEVNSGSYFIRSPLGLDEVADIRQKMSHKEKFARNVFVATFLFLLVVWYVLTETTPKETPVALLLCGLVAAFIKDCAIGYFCPVYIAVDGMTVCSRSSDLKYIDHDLTNRDYHDSAKKLIDAVAATGRPLMDFEYNLIVMSMLTLERSEEMAKQDVLR